MSDDDERQMLFLEGIHRKIFEIDKKMTAYMMARLELEVCDTKQEKLKVFREVRGNFEDLDYF